MYFNENYFFYIESLNETSGNHAQKQTKLVNARLPVVDLKKCSNKLFNNQNYRILYNSAYYNNIITVLMKNLTNVKIQIWEIYFIFEAVWQPCKFDYLTDHVFL